MFYLITLFRVMFDIMIKNYIGNVARAASVTNRKGVSKGTFSLFIFKHVGF